MALPAGGRVAAPTGEGAEAFVHADDIADVAVATLPAPAEHDGAGDAPTGPEALTLRGRRGPHRQGQRPARHPRRRAPRRLGRRALTPRAVQGSDGRGPAPDGDTATVSDHASTPDEHVLPDHGAPRAGGGPAGAPPVASGPEPSDAERARTLAATVTTGVLSTLARDPAGTPFGSLAPFGLDDATRPVLCISELAEHTQNLRQDPRGSLLVTQPAAPGTDPMAAARLTLLGRLEEVPEADRPAARAAHLAGNPHAELYVDYGDFALWRLEVESLRYVGGYGRMSWVTAAQWRAAEPDPVAPVAAGAVEHLNAGHADACLLIAQRLGGRPEAAEAVVTSLDRYGLDMVATGSDGTGRVRVPFAVPVTDAGEVRAASVELARRARQA